MVEEIVAYVPKHLDLPADEIARLEAEKREILAGMQRQIDAERPSLGTSREVAEDDDYAADLLPLTVRITVDGRKLSKLATAAKKADAVARALAEKLDIAQIAAESARKELRDYMKASGLA